MSDWSFGITLLVVGMGGTLASLWILSLIIVGLKKLFPYAKEAKPTSPEIAKGMCIPPRRGGGD